MKNARGVVTPREGEPVTRAEFDLLCEVVELALGVPGGVADQAQYLSWDGRTILEAFGKYRTEGMSVFATPAEDR